MKALLNLRVSIKNLWMILIALFKEDSTSMWNLFNYVFLWVHPVFGKVLLILSLMFSFTRLLAYVFLGRMSIPFFWFPTAGLVDSPVIRPAWDFLDWFIVVLVSLVLMLLMAKLTYVLEQEALKKHTTDYPNKFLLPTFTTSWFFFVVCVGFLELPFPSIPRLFGLL